MKTTTDRPAAPAGDLYYPTYLSPENWADEEAVRGRHPNQMEDDQ